MNNYLDGIYLNAVSPVKKIEQKSGLLNNKKGGTGIDFQRMIEEAKRASKKSSENKEVRPSTLNQNLDYAYMAMGSLLTKKRENKEI